MSQLKEAQTNLTDKTVALHHELCKYKRIQVKWFTFRTQILLKNVVLRKSLKIYRHKYINYCFDMFTGGGCKPEEESGTSKENRTGQLGR